MFRQNERLMEMRELRSHDDSLFDNLICTECTFSGGAPHIDSFGVDYQYRQMFLPARNLRSAFRLNR